MDKYGSKTTDLDVQSNLVCKDAPTFKLFSDAYDKPAAPDAANDRPVDERTVAAQAEQALGIICRNEDLGSNLRRTQLEEIFRSAANAGPQGVEKLVAQINVELASHGSRLRLSANYAPSTSIERSNLPANYADSGAFRVTVAAAQFGLYDGTSLQDTMQVRGRTLSSQRVHCFALE